MQTPQPHSKRDRDPAVTPAMSRVVLPRVVVAGLAGDTGKSLVALGVARAMRSRGHAVAPFKKGPDFIDAAWLGAATGKPGRNLDTFLMKREAISGSVAAAAVRGDQFAVIEGNRGLFDGMDAEGSHSTAALAKLIGAPVVLVIDATKVTRTVAAMVLGCRTLDPELQLRGVVLNRVGTARQERVIRQAIAAATDVPVLGAIPKLARQHLPSRHLGLVPAAERGDGHTVQGDGATADEICAALGETIAEHVDLDALEQIAAEAPPLPSASLPFGGPSTSSVAGDRKRVRIGVLRDAAFSFYYPENLEALEAAGAELVEISPLADQTLPEIDGLYAGGGFPEVYAERLSNNRALLEALRRRVAGGLAVWAECGGLMYLGEALRRPGEPGKAYPMVGALPLVLEQMPRPQGHGYVHGRIDGSNPFFAEGTELRGHEFHYSRVAADDHSPEVKTVMALDKGVGVGAGRDGVCKSGVVASYVHLHALGVPAWAPAFVEAAAGSTPLGAGGAR